jgi:hypothetical protein
MPEPTEEAMTVNERRKYMKLVKPRYQQAKRAERSRLLSEMEEVTGLHRKRRLALVTREEARACYTQGVSPGRSG